MTGEEFIKDICSKAQVQNSELVDIYNNPDKGFKHEMFHNMIDSIIKVKEENNSIDNPYVDVYAALVCIERLSSVIDNMYAYQHINERLNEYKEKHTKLLKEVEQGDDSK